MQDEERFHELCQRLRACWADQGMVFTCPPAPEEQVHASEAQLGFPLPPLLRMLYLEVANGGNGLVWYSEDFPLFGAHSGYPCRKLVNWPVNGPWREGGTIGDLVSRSGWTLHLCIAEALRRHPDCYVICDQPPDGFLAISTETFGLLVLDPLSGYIYELGDEANLLPFEENQPMPVLSLQFYKQSLEDMVEAFLAGAGHSTSAEAAADIVERDIALNRSRFPRRALTPELLDPACTAEPPVVWRGLYQGMTGLLIPGGSMDLDDLS